MGKKVVKGWITRSGVDLDDVKIVRGGVSLSNHAIESVVNKYRNERVSKIINKLQEKAQQHERAQ